MHPTQRAMSQGRSDRRGGRGDTAARSLPPLAAEVVAFMDRRGDNRVRFHCAAHTAVGPSHGGPFPFSGLRPADAAGAPFGPSAPPLRAEAPSPNTAAATTTRAARPGPHHTPCASLRRGQEALCVVTAQSLYVFPSERIPLEAIAELVVHLHCGCLDPVLEVVVAVAAAAASPPHPSSALRAHAHPPAVPPTSVETRFLCFADSAALQALTMALRAVAVRSRLVFHSTRWLPLQLAGERLGWPGAAAAVDSAAVSVGPERTFRSLLRIADAVQRSGDNDNTTAANESNNNNGGGGVDDGEGDETARLLFGKGAAALRATSALSAKGVADPRVTRFRTRREVQRRTDAASPSRGAGIVLGLAGPPPVGAGHGRYGDAAEALAAELRAMVGAVDAVIASGQPLR